MKIFPSRLQQLPNEKPAATDTYAVRAQSIPDRFKWKKAIAFFEFFRE